MSSPSTVRFAGPEDFDEIWFLMRMSYAENAVFPLSRKKAQERVRQALSPTNQQGAIGVIGPQDNLEGLAFLAIGTFWYSEALHLEEYMVYVHHEHRKSGHAKALLNWMEKQVEETALPLMTGVFSNSPRNEAKCRLYGRKFPKLGEFFFLQPKNATMFSGLAAVSS